MAVFIRVHMLFIMVVELDNANVIAMIFTRDIQDYVIVKMGHAILMMFPQMILALLGL